MESWTPLMNRPPEVLWKAHKNENAEKPVKKGSFGAFPFEFSPKIPGIFHRLSTNFGERLSSEVPRRLYR